MDVPFLFNGDENVIFQQNNERLKFNLVFRKNSSGDMEAALRTSSIQPSNKTGIDKDVSFQSYMLLSGELSTVWISKGGKYKFEKRQRISQKEVEFFKIKSAEAARTKSLECSIIPIVSTHVDCSGGYNTVCFLTTDVSYIVDCSGNSGGGWDDISGGNNNNNIDWPPHSSGGNGSNNSGTTNGSGNFFYDNHDIIDSLRGYPCAQEILKRLPNLNSEVEGILQNVFGVYDTINLKFSIDTSLTENSQNQTTVLSSLLDL